MGRPVFFNLAQIQMPVGALTSIAHRITGLVMAFGVPLNIYILDLSLQSSQSYERVTVLFEHWHSTNRPDVAGCHPAHHEGG